MKRTHSLCYIALIMLIGFPLCSVASQDAEANEIARGHFSTYILKCGDGYYFWGTELLARGGERLQIKEIKGPGNITVDKSALSEFDKEYGTEFRGSFSFKYEGLMRVFRIGGQRWTDWVPTSISFRFGLKKEGGKWSIQRLKDKLYPISCNQIPGEEPAIKVTEWTALTPNYKPQSSLEAYIKGRLDSNTQVMIKSHGKDWNALNFFIGSKFIRPDRATWQAYLDREDCRDWAVVSRKYKGRGGRVIEDVVLYIQQNKWGWAGIDTGSF